MVMTRNPLCKDLHKKGKCEKFHQIVDRFLAEVKVHNIRTLEGSEPSLEQLSGKILPYFPARRDPGIL